MQNAMCMAASPEVLISIMSLSRYSMRRPVYGSRTPGSAHRVSGLGLVGSYKTLEPMKIADTITYGNYFELPGVDKYRIDLDVERPQGTVKFEFTYAH